MDIGHQRSDGASANRDAGVLVWRDETITRDKYRELLLEKVVPAIAEKWPRHEWESPRTIIRIQQDGAKSHIHPINDAAFWQGMAELGFENKMLLYTQPANSPDTNINDLGFFRALQLMFHDHCPNDEAEIIQYVTMKNNEYDHSKINSIWLTLMSCYNMIIDCHGGNDYKIPHIGKRALERNGELPQTLAVTNTSFSIT